MNIALAQIEGSDDKELNLAHIGDFVARARHAGADLVLFPECAMAALTQEQDPRLFAETLDGPFVSALASLASLHGITIAVGMYETLPGGGAANTVVALGPDGSFLGSYRKTHMFDAFGYRESDWVTPGSGETLVFPLGDLTVGLATCYDVRFPEIFRHLADRGADVILLPAAWAFGPLKESHWEVLVRARAIENTVYMAATGLAGARFTGSSMLVDPMGVPIVRLDETPGLAVGTVERTRLAEVREKLPSREHIRPEIYARWQPVPR